MDVQLLKYISGELSQKEVHNLLQRVDNDESLRKDLINLQSIYSVSQLTTEPGDNSEGRKAYEKLLSKINNEKRIKRITYFLRYAAVVTLLLLSTIFGTVLLKNSYSDKTLNTLYVPAGQRARITLHDGTEVWLNAQSTLVYPSKFNKNHRTVDIEGEAYFDVSKDNKRPFRVNTNQVNIEVLGTQFNLYSYDEANFVETTLVEGSLKVFDNQNEDNVVLLKPNEQATFKNGILTVAPVSNPDHLLWKDGIYSFENEALIDIIYKLELYYDIDIEVEDPEIFNVTYTGKFRQRDGIDEILRILQIIQPFKIEKKRDENRIILSK